MPNTRRTSKEVAEANARKEELRAKLAKAEQDKLELLARMAMEEDMDAKAEEAAAVRSLQDVSRTPDNAVVEPDNQEGSQPQMAMEEDMDTEAEEAAAVWSLQDVSMVPDNAVAEPVNQEGSQPPEGTDEEDHPDSKDGSEESGSEEEKRDNMRQKGKARGLPVAGSKKVHMEIDYDALRC